MKRCTAIQEDNPVGRRNGIDAYGLLVMPGELLARSLTAVSANARQSSEH